MGPGYIKAGGRKYAARLQQKLVSKTGETATTAAGHHRAGARLQAARHGGCLG